MRCYLPHNDYIATARLTPDLPRLVIGVIAIELIYGVALDFIGSILAAFPPQIEQAYFYGTTSAGLLAQLFSFAFLAGAVMLVARYLHFRPPLSLIGPPKRALQSFALALIAALGCFLALEILPPYWSSAGAVSTGGLRWLVLLPVSVAALPVQVAAEELLYRGYVQQQLAARFASPWIWLTVRIVLFAAASWDNGSDPVDAIQYVIWAFCFGLVASDLTARTGSLGAATGFHLANNIYAFLFFSERGAPDSGLALFLFPPGDLLPPSTGSGSIITVNTVLELATLLVMWLSIRWALRR